MMKQLKTLLLAILIFLFSAQAFAGIMLLGAPKFHMDDDDGAPLVGGLVYTYEPGTTTNKTAYKDYDLSNAHENPITLNSRGEAPNALYLNGGYKVMVYSDPDGDGSPDSLVWSEDNINIGDIAEGYNASNNSTLNAAHTAALAAGAKRLLVKSDIAADADITWDAGLGLKTYNGAQISGSAGTETLDLDSCPKFDGSPGCFDGSTLTVSNLKVGRVNYWGNDSAAFNYAKTACDNIIVDSLVTFGATDVVLSTYMGGIQINDGTLYYDSTGRLTGLQIHARPEFWQENTTPGTTSMAAAIGYADAAVEDGCKEVDFRGIEYLIDSTISKSGHTTWNGSPGGVNGQDSYIGTKFTNGYNGNMIEMDYSSTSTYMRYAKIRDIHMQNDLSTYGSAVAIYIKYAREFIFQDLFIQGFEIGIGLTQCGEIYFNRCFIWGGSYGVDGDFLADSYSFQNTYGSGLSATGVTGGNGFRLRRSGNFTSAQDRFQVMESGYGFLLQNARNVSFSQCIFDQNELHGAMIWGSENIDFNGCRFFDNGTTGSNQAGCNIYGSKVEISSVSSGDDTITLSGASQYMGYMAICQFTTSDTLPSPLTADTTYYLNGTSTVLNVYASEGDVSTSTKIDLTDAGVGTHYIHNINEDIRFTGGWSGDRNLGETSQRQTDGIKFSGPDSFTRRIVIDGVDLTQNDDGIEGETNVDADLRVLNCLGYVNTNSGTGSITSGSTSDVITHGLDITPSAKNIIITLTENPTNTPGAIWVDTITSTQFTVNCENNPGASNLDFGWMVVNP